MMNVYTFRDKIRHLRSIGFSWESISILYNRTPHQIRNISKMRKTKSEHLRKMGNNTGQIIYRKKYPEKVFARKKVYTALRNKTLKRRNCMECGNVKSEAHHEDYGKPLDVIWLCKLHHRMYDLALRNKA